MLAENVNAELGNGTFEEWIQVIDNIVGFRWKCITAIIGESRPFWFDRKSIVPELVVRVRDHIVANICVALSASSIAAGNALFVSISCDTCTPLLFISASISSCCDYCAEWNRLKELLDSFTSHSSLPWTWYQLTRVFLAFSCRARLLSESKLRSHQNLVINGTCTLSGARAECSPYLGGPTSRRLSTISVFEGILCFVFRR